MAVLLLLLFDGFALIDAGIDHGAKYVVHEFDADVVLIAELAQQLAIFHQQLYRLGIDAFADEVVARNIVAPTIVGEQLVFNLLNVGSGQVGYGFFIEVLDDVIAELVDQIVGDGLAVPLFFIEATQVEREHGGIDLEVWCAIQAEFFLTGHLLDD